MALFLLQYHKRNYGNTATVVKKLRNNEVKSTGYNNAIIKNSHLLIFIVIAVRNSMIDDIIQTNDRQTLLGLKAQTPDATDQPMRRGAPGTSG